MMGAKGIEFTQINIRGNKNDEFGGLELTKRNNRPVLSNPCIHEIIRVYHKIDSIEENSSITTDIKSYKINGSVMWGINRFTGAPYIRSDIEMKRERYIGLLISNDFDLIDYEVNSSFGTIIHTFKYPKSKHPNCPKMGCIIKVDESDMYHIVSSLRLRRIDRPEKSTKVLIRVYEQFITFDKTTSKEKDDSKPISLRTSFRTCPTDILVYDSSKTNATDLDGVARILIDISGKSIDEAVSIINTTSYKYYNYKPEALSFTITIPRTVAQEIIKRMRLKYAYHILSDNFRSITIRSK